MKTLISGIAFGVAALFSQNALADSFTLYCNTLVQLKAVTPSWVTNQAVEAGLKSMGYSTIRDSDFRGSDFKQVSVQISAPNPVEALRIAITSVCKNERIRLEDSLLSRFGAGRIPLDATIYQCGYVYDASGKYVNQGCPAIPALEVR